MHLLVVSGMLGVGKTSVILKLLEPMIERQTRVVVIENDFGEFGIDTEVLERAGLKVRDLKGGCVCCTLQGGLVDSLRALQLEYDPEVAIVEPTGIADPEFIINSVTDVTGIRLDGYTVAVVVDSERFLKVKKMFERPLKNQLKVAKIVLLNKIDTVTSDDLDQIESDIRGFGFDGKVIRVRADTGEGMEGILEVMEL